MCIRDRACVSDKNFEMGLYLMKELYMVVEEAKRLTGYREEDDDRDVDLNILIDDVRVHNCLAESLKEIHDGDKLLHDAVHGHETLQIDLVYDAVDKYRYAITLSRGEDLEILCIARTKVTP